MRRHLHSTFHSLLKAIFFFCLTGILPVSLFSQDWNTCGGNSARNGLSPILGPQSPDILWQGTETGLFGMPIYIEGNILVTNRFISLTDAPVVCHDLYTGQLLWTADVTNGTGRSIPIGIRDGRVYVMRFLEGPDGDSLVALDALTGNHLWTAEMLIRPATMVGCAFASNGDLIIEGNLMLLRIDATNGNTVWAVPMIPWVVGWLSPAIYENTIYVQQNALESIAAVDINTGAIKYTHEVLPLGGNAQTEIMVGTDGTIYAMTTGTGGLITALQDNGDSLSILWTTPTLGYSVFCYMAESPDSTIYAPSNGKIIRILKSNGAILDSSAAIGSPTLFIAMVSVGSDGIVYISSENTFLCTNPDLTPLFLEIISNINTSGCALGQKNTLAVAGSGTELRVYKSNPTLVNEEVDTRKDEALLYPNPAKDILFIQSKEKVRTIACLDYTGRSMDVSLENNVLDISSLSEGLYFITITTSSGAKLTGRFIKEE